VIVVDTNVLVYAADADAPLHHECRNWLDHRRSRPDAWFTTWPILYEFMRVVTHPRVLRQTWNLESAWQFVSAMLASPGVSVLRASERHVDVAAQMVVEYPRLRGSVLHDFHTAVLMREHGIKQICTRDMGFHQFPFLEVIDPVRDK
jgi:toxin-antitoxin system PIN domain toxin